MIDVNSKFYEVFENLKNYIKANYDKEVNIWQYVEDDIKYPLILCQTITNNLTSNTIDRVYETRSVSFNVEIYALSNEEEFGFEICDRLSNLVIDIFQRIYNMQGGIIAKLQNINTAKAFKIVMNFRCDWWLNKNENY